MSFSTNPVRCACGNKPRKYFNFISRHFVVWCTLCGCESKADNVLVVLANWTAIVDSLANHHRRHRENLAILKKVCSDATKHPICCKQTADTIGV